ncbi:MAG: Ku protein [Bryobacteraceae bacterium]
MASTVWKGYISFGLISIPVRLHAAARSERISFNQLHEKCNSRIKQQLYCPSCERTVERSEIVKGYPVEKDTYVVVEDEEIKKIAPESSETMEILEFVKLDEVDPLYFDTSYYAVPEEPGKRAYQLLLETMEKAGYAAMAKLAMHQREYTVIIRPRSQGLTLHTIHYADEVREIPEYGRTTDVQVKPQEIELAQQLVKSLAAPFEPEKYQDAYQNRLMEMVEAKSQGKSVRETATRKLAPVIDLMAALQKSLSEKAPAGDGAKKPAARSNIRDISEQTPKPRKSRRASGE